MVHLCAYGFFFARYGKYTVQSNSMDGSNAVGRPEMLFALSDMSCSFRFHPCLLSFPQKERVTRAEHSLTLTFCCIVPWLLLLCLFLAPDVCVRQIRIIRCSCSIVCMRLSPAVHPRRQGAMLAGRGLCGIAKYMSDSVGPSCGLAPEACNNLIPTVS